MVIIIYNKIMNLLQNSFISQRIITLHAEQYMTIMLGTDGFTEVFKVFFGLGISLIVLKFLKKGFETYILWTEGDADADPLLLLTNFFKALAVAVSFPVLYIWLADIVDKLTNKLLNAIGKGMQDDFTVFVNGIASVGLFTSIVSLIMVNIGE